MFFAGPVSPHTSQSPTFFNLSYPSRGPLFLARGSAGRTLRGTAGALLPPAAAAASLKSLSFCGAPDPKAQLLLAARRRVGGSQQGGTRTLNSVLIQINVQTCWRCVRASE